MHNTEIRYTREKPEEWDTLVDAIAPKHTEPARPFNFETAEYALRAANELETQALEANTYYALGLGMRGLAKSLHDEKQRLHIAGTIARALDETGSQMEQIINEPTPGGFNALTEAAYPLLVELGVQTYTQLPVREHLASDALTIATRVRRLGAHPFVFSDGRSNTAHIHNVRRGNAAATLITSNATAGSVVVHSHLRAAQAAATQPAKAPQKPLRLAVQSAALHTEEFQGELYQRAVTYSPDGAVTLDRDHIPTQPQLPEQRLTDIKHTERLGCPAIQVQHAIPGMLQLMLDIEQHQARTA